MMNTFGYNSWFIGCNVFGNKKGVELIMRSLKLIQGLGRLLVCVCVS